MGVRVVHNPSLVHDIPSILMPKPVLSPWKINNLLTFVNILIDMC